MKNILYHTLSLLFASLFFVACTQESVPASFEKEGDVTLTLRLSSGDLQSRAEAGNDAYNENAITKVDLYLYPAGGTGSALHKVSRTFTATTSEATITETLDNDLIEQLFGNSGTTCQVYALVNYMGEAPAHTAADDDGNSLSTIAALKALEISPNSTPEEDEGGVATFATTPQPSFVMDGEATVNYSRDAREIEGTVQVKRAASKIGFFVTGVDKTVLDDAGNTWIPNYEGMEVSFHNGVNKAKVDVGYTTEDRPNNTLSAGSYYATSGNRNINIDGEPIDKDTYYSLTTTHAPFYSYSSDWGRAENPDTEPTITLMVPWKKIKDAEGKDIANPDWQSCYYQIPVNVKSIGGSLADCMERNMYYKISFHVGILGDFNPATPTIITASYYTVVWETENVDVDIKNYKYLVVDKNDVTVYNENEVRIGYASSDAIQAEITYIRRPDYSDEEVDTTRFHGTLESTSGLSTVLQGTNSLLRQCAVTIENNEIVLKHDIVNQSANSGTNYDYVPYYIWIKVTMTVTVNGKNKTFTEWIRYEQYPEIYIKAYPNDVDDDHKGYVYVYNNKENSGDQWQRVRGASDGANSGSNSNPNMYVITVSALGNESNYILGDPRKTTYISGNANGWNIGNVDASESKTLQFYYETKTDANAELTIAPRFRMASSHGKCNQGISLTDAKRRCAAYQEDGYPAGRWRVPTTAEFKYIAKLSGENKIPHLYSSGKYYWTSTEYCTYRTDGTIQENNSTTTDNQVYVRCVYDEWYWGNEQLTNKTAFTWGDAERN